jgi:hypothetical protein
VTPLRENVTDAIRFWERGRVVYNAALLFVSFIATKSADATAYLFSPVALATWLALGVLANVLYCTAYPVDLFVQISDYKPTWRKWGRPILLVLGTTFACFFAYHTAYSLGRMSVT